MARDTGDSIAVDFVWGNLPMQPDDDRDGDGTATELHAANAVGDRQWSAIKVWPSAPLDATKGNHAVATTNYNGFPGYTPVEPFLDLEANTEVPDLLGATESEATTLLTAAGLVKGEVTTSDAGATAENDGLVKSQSKAAEAKVNVGTEIDLVLFAYTAPEPEGDGS